MSSTRSPSRKAPATDARPVLIVAHGSPSAPATAEQAIRGLAARVEHLLTDRTVVAATLAAPGALEAMLVALPGPPLVYPMFMADGWFVRSALPTRLAEAGHRHAAITAPFGLDPAVWALCLNAAAAAAAGHGMPSDRTTVLIAAHGSSSDPRPRAAAERAATFVVRHGRFASVRTGFIDETPLLLDAARVDGPAICLPFFASQAGHVLVDVPKALARAGFDGPVLAPIGTHHQVPRIIADAITATGECGDCNPTSADRILA